MTLSRNVTNNVTGCRWCGGELSQPKGRGRRRKFCSAACKQRAYESRKWNMPEIWDHLETFHECYLCSKPLDWGKREEIVTDHVIATVRGGVTEPWNLRPVHLKCNARKGAKLFIA